MAPAAKNAVAANAEELMVAAKAEVKRVAAERMAVVTAVEKAVMAARRMDKAVGTQIE